MPPKLYLCRHGQTDWNAAGRLQGKNDVPLNELGRSQARRNGRFLREVLGDAAITFDFVSSPLSRAMETMRIIRAEIGLVEGDFRTDDRLIELSFGDWQGLTLGEIGDRDPAGLKRRKADKWNFVPPGQGAESYDILSHRVAPIFEGMSQSSVITAHGGVTRSFLRLYGGLEERAAAQTGIAQDKILSCTTLNGRQSIEWV